MLNPLGPRGPINIQIYGKKTACIAHIVYKGRLMAGKVNYKGVVPSREQCTRYVL
jgi:hypothetical protein